ncbi:MAG: hypothetical protein ACI9J3_001280 [Parvicellaceae bacterium]|jgi:hypothetical protein
MKKNYLLLILSFFLLSTGWTQVTNMAGPVSWKAKVKLVAPPVEVMPAFDMNQQLLEDSINNANKVGPWRFGFNHYVDLNLNNSGLWTSLPNGDRIWRIELKSANALTINLVFDLFDIPDGGFVYLYDKDRTNRVGAYTSRNNNPEQKLGTELVHGDHIVLEYYEPQAVQGQGQLKIGAVTHGYRELGTYANSLGNNLMKALNSSGDCNIDVNCPLGTGWEDQIRSVAMIVVGGNGICTGALINNVSCDFTPYFLTANHCYSGSIATWSFRFNWESPPGTESCATTAGSTDPGGPYDQTSNGGTVRANDSGSDFLLLEMNMLLAEAQSWNVFFAGWDNSETAPTQVTGIHHPSGDVKKICQDGGAIFDTWNFNGDPNTEVWRINDWTQGVTEPGSSGSPLFDQNGRIIGDLSGGTAACSGTNDNGGYDGYGRFGVSWTGGGSAATRVRDWLDPANTSTTNDGCDPNAPVSADDAGIQSIVDPTGNLCGTGSFIPQVELHNYGSASLSSVTINYDLDGGTNQVFNWTGTLASGGTTPVVLPTMTAGNGAHVFNVSTALPNGNADGNTANDADLSNFNVLLAGQLIDFTLDLDCWGSEVTWTVEDASSNVLYSGGPYTDLSPGGAGQITEQWCLDAGCYDFTINDSYGDGMYGSQYGSCTADGTYQITDASSTVLASMIAANSDYGNQEINNFCVSSPCPTITVTTTGTDVSCNGVCDGSATVTVSGGTAPYTYSWSSSGTSATETGLCAGTYTVTVTDANGCTGNEVVTINEPSATFVTTTSTDASCNGGCDGNATATGGGGTPPYTYLWSSGGTSATETGLCAGTYTVTITDANGCTANDAVLISEPSAVIVTISSTDVSCNGACDGTASANATGGTAPYTYFWSPSGGATGTLTGLCAGSYTVTVTDANGCTTNQVVIVNEPSAAFVTTTSTDASCNGVCDGTAIATGGGGTPPYTYSWSSGGNSATATGLCAGTHAVTITDANGCTANDLVIINEPSAVIGNTTTTDENCGLCDGSATVVASGGSSPYTYSWPSGGASTTETGLCAGGHTVNITDANGCTGSEIASINSGGGPTITTSSTDVSCNGVCDGTATTSISGGTPPYTYQWDAAAGSQTTATATGLCAGTYSITATDAIGCSGASNVTINEPSAVFGTTSSTDATCGNCNGTATVIGGGGNPGYSYQWDAAAGNQTTATATNLCAGSYSVIITDASGCAANEVVTVVATGAPSVNATTTDVSCNGACDGSATITLSGGTSPFTYLWSSGGNGATETGLCAGTYTVDVTDASGCTANDVVTINEPTSVIGNITTTDENCGLCDGTATIVASGGTGPYTYSWSSAGTSSTETGLCVGTYIATIVDANGCTGSATATIGSSGGPTLTTTSTDVSCNGACDGAATVNASGGAAPYTYLWSTGGNGATETGLCAGTYTVTVTDASGCATAVIITINEPAAIALTATTTDESAGNDGAIDLTVTGGTTAYTYSWSNGLTTEDLSGLVGGSYTVIVTDANGCVDSLVVSVNSSVGIKDQQDNGINFNIYPNPGDGYFNILLSDLQDEDISIDLVDVQGKLIWSALIRGLTGDHLKTIDLTNESNGVYFLRIINQETVSSAKIIKQ